MLKSMLAVLALLSSASLWASGANRYQFRPKDMASNPTWKVPQFILADTESDLPSVQVYEGDLAYTKDSDKLWKRDSSSWVEVGPGGGGGAPTNAQYWTGAADSGLSAEKNLGALSTGLVINTAGVPSAYSGTSCTDQFPRGLNASGSASCASVVDADITGISGAKVSGAVASATSATSAATATALASNPTDCTAGNYATTIDTGANLTCAQVAYAQVSGTPTLAYQTIRDETSALTARASVNFTGAGVSCVDNAGQARTDCTIAGGGGGGGNGVEVSVALADGLGATTVTGQAWVGSASFISCSPMATTADGLTADAYTIAQLSSVVSARVAGTGFTLTAVSALKPTGTFRFSCLGV